METVNKRLFRLLGNKHGVQREFANFIGVSETTVNAWKTRGSGIDSELISKIAEFLKVSDTYLLRGEETKNEFLSQEEIDLINLYRSASEKGQEEIMNFAEYTSRRWEKEDDARKIDDIRKQIEEMEANDEAISTLSSLAD